mmetsp:Transcript_124214/g.322669  ORF Transcript_124214/g.322669 Transcript_124214/m.322669 type:complete len:201 (-) Transcript_124214:1336-1938(-)
MPWPSARRPQNAKPRACRIIWSSTKFSRAIGPLCHCCCPSVAPTTWVRCWRFTSTGQRSRVGCGASTPSISGVSSWERSSASKCASSWVRPARAPATPPASSAPPRSCSPRCSPAPWAPRAAAGARSPPARRARSSTRAATPRWRSTSARRPSCSARRCPAARPRASTRPWSCATATRAGCWARAFSRPSITSTSSSRRS